jgi:hypothetical protein
MSNSGLILKVVGCVLFVSLFLGNIAGLSYLIHISIGDYIYPDEYPPPINSTEIDTMKCLDHYESAWYALNTSDSCTLQCKEGCYRKITFRGYGRHRVKVDEILCGSYNDWTSYLHKKYDADWIKENDTVTCHMYDHTGDGYYACGYLTMCDDTETCDRLYKSEIYLLSNYCNDNDVEGKIVGASIGIALSVVILAIFACTLACCVNK